MTFTDKYGHELQEGDIVTYDVFDETDNLQLIKPFRPHLKKSRIVIGKDFDSLELCWQYGVNYRHVNVVTLDAETAQVLTVIGHSDEDNDSD